jgi:hypothetical protein
LPIKQNIEFQGVAFAYLAFQKGLGLAELAAGVDDFLLPRVGPHGLVEWNGVLLQGE